MTAGPVPPISHYISKPIVAYVFVESKFIKLKPININPIWHFYHKNLDNITLIKALHPFTNLNQISYCTFTSRGRPVWDRGSGGENITFCGKVLGTIWQHSDK